MCNDVNKNNEDDDYVYEADKNTWKFCIKAAIQASEEKLALITLIALCLMTCWTKDYERKLNQIWL